MAHEREPEEVTAGRRSLWDDPTPRPDEAAPPLDPAAEGPAAGPPVADPKGRWGWLRQTLLGLAALAVLAAVLSLGSLLKPDEGVELKLDGRLALLPLVNETGSEAYDWMSEGWSEMVAQSLSRTPGVALIPPQRLAHEVKVRGLDGEQEALRSQVRSLAVGMGAEVIFDGVVRRLGARRGDLRPLSGDREPLLRLEMRLLSAQGEVLADAELQGDDAIELADRLVVSLARGLSSEGEPVRLEAVYSPNVFLDQLYGLALTAQRAGRLQRAEEIFLLLQEQEPSFLAAGLGLLQTRLAADDCGGCTQLAQRLLEQARVRGERRIESAVLQVLARLEALSGRGPAAQELLSQARAVLPQEARDEHLQVAREMALLALLQDRPDEAKELFDKLLIEERLVGNVLAQASLLLELGSLELSRGELEAAQGALEQALRLAQEQSDPWLEARSVSSLGEVARRLGDNDRASQYWQDALASYRRPADGQRRLLLLRNLAELALEERRFDEAEDHLFAVRDLAAELQAPAYEAAACLRLSWVMLRTGYPRQAREHLDRTLRLDRWITDERLALQQVIAWFAYEEGNFQLAVETQERARQQAEGRWRPIDNAFLAAYRAALATGQRVPVPGEEETRLAPRNSDVDGDVDDAEVGNRGWRSGRS